MRNMASMMKKVQGMQDQLEMMKSDLAVMEFTAIVGGGAVSATVTGETNYWWPAFATRNKFAFLRCIVR